MPILETIYPFGLAVANIAVGWLLYGTLNSSISTILASVGVIIILAVVHDIFEATTRRSRTPSHRISGTYTAEPPERVR